MSRVTLEDKKLIERQPAASLLEADHTLWELRLSPGKGAGMFARKDIQKGTRLVADECLLYLPEPKPLLENIERAFNKLSPAQQEAYLALHCPDRPGRSPVVRIWEANCFRRGEGAGMFLKASRINHSCTPNAHFEWNENIQRETIHATLDIKANKEITISYCYPHSDVYNRQQKLEPYGFDCDCAPCLQDTDYGRASEVNRRRMGELLQEIVEIREGLRMETVRHGCDDELNARLELIELLEKESLYQLELGNQYHCVATCYECRQDKVKALEYAKKGARIALGCVGPDSEIFHGDLARIQELEEK